MSLSILLKRNFKEYREIINPPYKKEDILTILPTILILVSIPLTVFAIITFREQSVLAATTPSNLSPSGSVPSGNVTFKWKPATGTSGYNMVWLKWKGSNYGSGYFFMKSVKCTLSCSADLSGSWYYVVPGSKSRVTMPTSLASGKWYWEAISCGSAYCTNMADWRISSASFTVPDNTSYTPPSNLEATDGTCAYGSISFEWTLGTSKNIRLEVTNGNDSSFSSAHYVDLPSGSTSFIWSSTAGHTLSGNWPIQSSYTYRWRLSDGTKYIDPNLPTFQTQNCGATYALPSGLNAHTVCAYGFVGVFFNWTLGTSRDLWLDVTSKEDVNNNHAYDPLHNKYVAGNSSFTWFPTIPMSDGLVPQVNETYYWRLWDNTKQDHIYGGPIYINNPCPIPLSNGFIDGDRPNDYYILFTYIDIIAAGKTEPLTGLPLADVMKRVMNAESGNSKMCAVGTLGETGVFQFMADTWQGNAGTEATNYTDSGSVISPCWQNPGTDSYAYWKVFGSPFGKNYDANAWDPYAQARVAMKMMLAGQARRWTTFRLIYGM